MTLSQRKKGRNNKNEEEREKKSTCIPPSKELQKQMTLHEHPPTTSVNPLAVGLRN